MCVTKDDPLCLRVSSFYYYFIMQSSWRSLEINIAISFIVIFFSFKRPQALQASLHSFFSLVSKIMGYCCAPNLQGSGSPVHSYGHARYNHFSYLELGKDV